MRYLFGLIMIAIGSLFILKTDWFIRNVGRNAWAEDKLGEGGTWTFYKLLGVVFILFAFVIMSGKIYNILDFLFVAG